MFCKRAQRHMKCTVDRDVFGLRRGGCINRRIVDVLCVTRVTPVAIDVIPYFRTRRDVRPFVCE